MSDFDQRADPCPIARSGNCCPDIQTPAALNADSASVWFSACLTRLQFQAALERVRAGADVMPRRQLEQVTACCGLLWFGPEQPLLGPHAWQTC